MKTSTSKISFLLDGKMNLQRGDCIRLAGFLRTDDGELFCELFEIFSEISSCN